MILQKKGERSERIETKPDDTNKYESKPVEKEYDSKSKDKYDSKSNINRFESKTETRYETKYETSYSKSSRRVRTKRDTIVRAEEVREDGKVHHVVTMV